MPALPLAFPPPDVPDMTGKEIGEVTDWANDARKSYLINNEQVKAYYHDILEPYNQRLLAVHTEMAGLTTELRARRDALTVELEAVKAEIRTIEAPFDQQRSTITAEKRAALPEDTGRFMRREQERLEERFQSDILDAFGLKDHDARATVLTMARAAATMRDSDGDEELDDEDFIQAVEKLTWLIFPGGIIRPEEPVQAAPVPAMPYGTDRGSLIDL